MNWKYPQPAFIQRLSVEQTATEAAAAWVLQDGKAHVRYAIGRGLCRVIQREGNLSLAPQSPTAWLTDGKRKKALAGFSGERARREPLPVLPLAGVRTLKADR